MAKEIQLTKGCVALVDEVDYEMIVGIGLRWCTSDGYAFNSILGRMHRFLLNAPDGVMVDHVNGNKLDNRRENLRLCTNSQNQANRKISRGKSSFKGVTWQRRSNGSGFWKAQIIVRGEVIYLGAHVTDLEAAKAYNDAAIEHFGEFAALNDLSLPASQLTSSVRNQIKRATPSGFKGVSYDRRRDKWMAQLRFKGVTYLKKRFSTAGDAARAYDATAKKVFGDTAVLNF